MDGRKPKIPVEALPGRNSGIELVQPDWGRSGWVRAGFSTRRGGISSAYGGDALNLGWTEEDTYAAVTENRRRLVRAIAAGLGDNPEMRLVIARQVHSAKICILLRPEDVLEAADGRPALEGDGLVTDVPGLLLGVGTADCVPVLVADPQGRAIGAFHAGWRGTLQRIVEKGVATMAEVYGSRAGDLVAAVGPSVGRCCYAVGEEVRSRFTEEFEYADELFQDHGRSEVGIQTGGHTKQEIFFDLWEANRRQLVDAGLSPERISVVGECTACARDGRGAARYFSHRAERGVTGRMLSVVGVVDPLPGR